ncbi:Oidioi.mRNA.OKI2018_I69.XSR.g15472.t1.cds [Oikopleura dioica]|uniref:Oidioi.mRNA.OKI2018_I69.XSR.g15472.t1.cds n=1 Tax=Oikopleura dioica TaxID=34765 RepID=A0ABN7SDJ0_OIKDI|nr:Oidioi.mRNA.OKI2018_I69.XSR.g15472.t1.cds [Oikopleura dioica]
MSSKASSKPILRRVYDQLDSEPEDLRKKLSRVRDSFDALDKELFPSGRPKDIYREPQLFPGTEDGRDKHHRRVRTIKPVLKRIVDPIEPSSGEEDDDLVIVDSKPGKSRKHRKRSGFRERRKKRKRSRSSSPS